MSKNKFQLTPCKYQSLSNRMERLKHLQNHSNSTSNLRSASVNHLQNKPLTRTTSTALLVPQNQTSVLKYLQDQSCLDVGNRYSGRVTKNTGIRKYNQRMLKQVGNITKKITPPKYTHAQPVIQTSYAPNLTNNYTSNKNQNSSIHMRRQIQDLKYKPTPQLTQNTVYKAKSPQQTITKQVQYKQQRIKLQPGKIYTRQQLQNYFKF